MGYQKYVKELYKNVNNSLKDETFKALWTERKKKWRHGRSVVRQDGPIRVDAARKIGYKKKQGFVVARCRIRRGSLRKSRPARGRKPKKQGVKKITMGKSTQRMAEERSQKRFSNLEVLGSYWLYEDGKYKWYEVILVDPAHPSIKKDGDVKWISEKQHRNRALRGLTPAGKKGRGLTKKGKGAEKVRPSLRAKGGLAK